MVMDNNSEYINLFNQQSEQYSLYRPDYPEELFDYLSRQVRSNAVVWDCGTGTGQAAKSLATRFKRVIATDINAAQLAAAPQLSNIEYHCCPADHTSIHANSINLVTIAQALHWFSFESFYEEVRRVGASDGLIAAWCYSLGYFNVPLLDEAISTLYYDILGSKYWPKERFYIDEQYKTIPFPFKRIETPEFSIQRVLSFSQLIGYLSTWSAVKEYQRQHQQNPLELVFGRLQAAWGNLEKQNTICWPLHCLLGHIHLGENNQSR